MWAIPWCSCWGRTPPLSNGNWWQQLGLDQPFDAVLALWSMRRRVSFGLILRQGGEGVAPDANLPFATLELALVAAFSPGLWAFLMVCGAEARRSPVNKHSRTISLLGVSPPTFLIGILLILVFSVTLGWFPALVGAGRADGLVELGADDSQRAAPHHLPVITWPFSAHLIMRLVREMLEVLRTDYIKFARARGLSNRHPLWSCPQEHACSGAHDHGSAAGWSDRIRHHHRDGVPVASTWASLFIQAVTFAVVIPVLAAYLCLIALIFVVINLVVDLLSFV